MTIKPQFLWQIGFVGSGSATVTGCLFNNDGASKRFSVTVTTTASGFRALITPTVWDAFQPVAATILSVTSATVYVNTGAAFNGDWATEAPTSADESIAAASYATDPVTFVAAEALAI